MAAATSHQRQFNDTYISSPEIVRRLGITRTALSLARKRGVVPEPIVVKDTTMFFWMRKEVEPILRLWAERLSKRTDR